MKKTVSFLFMLCLCTTAGFAQNLISKVPATASLVIKYSGTSLSQKLPAAKFDSYTALKNKIFKEFKLSSKTTLEDIGIDLQQDAYQYLVTSDTTTNFVTIAAIKDAATFNKFIQTKKSDSVAIESKTGFQFYKISSSVFLGWDGKFASVVIAKYTPADNYYNNYNSTATVDSTTVAVDSASVASAAPVDSVRMMPDTTAAIITAPATDSVVIDTAAIARDNAFEIAEQKEEQQREFKNDSIQSAVAKDILSAIYNENNLSIESNSSFGKLVNKNADINIWIDSSGIFNRFYPRASGYNFNNWLGFVQGINVYFEPAQIRVEQKVLSGKDSAAKLFRAVLDSKQDPALANYVHPADLGYLSMSINTEAMINYYYMALKKMLPAKGSFGLDSSLVDVYVDLMQIVIDEKGIADMLPGNSIFILHNLKSKTVKYTSYDYDKNFNSITKEKTKTELSPDFCIVFTTRNEKIFDKLADLPIRLRKDNNYDYTKTGDFYTLKLGPDEYVDKLYFKVKNGQCIITTSLQDVVNPTYNQSTTLDATTKASILNDNYSAKFNIKDLIKGLSSQLTDKDDKKRLAYLQNNINDISFKSTVTDDSFNTTTILTTAGNHKNSFEYLFDVIEQMLEIGAPVK